MWHITDAVEVHFDFVMDITLSTLRLFSLEVFFRILDHFKKGGVDVAYVCHHQLLVFCFLLDMAPQ